MKKLAIFCLTIVLSMALRAEPLLWNSEAAIRQGSNIEWTRAAISTSDNGVVYSWSDTRDGDRDLWVQKVDANGAPLWGANGKKVNGAVDRQEDMVVIDAENGGVILAWIDYRADGNGDVYAQKMDGNGNLLWNNNGVVLCSVSGTQIDLNIANDAAGGAYVIWQDSRNSGGTDLYGVHILSTGTLATGWNANGNALVNAAGDQSGHTFWEDGAGGAILSWVDKRDANNISIYMQRIMPDGSLAWGANGKLLAGGVGDKSSVKVTPDGSGSFILVWRDRGSDTNGDLKAQRVGLDGNFMWTSAQPVHVGSGIQINPRVAKASDGGAVIVWEDGRTTPDYMDLYAQKLGLDGSKKWAADGVLVSDSVNDQVNPRLIGDDNGGSWLVWEDCRTENHPSGDIYAQHINGSGAIQLTAGGAPVCNVAGYQHAPLIRKTSGGKVVISWGDDRTGSTGIYLKSFGQTEQLPAAETLMYYGLSGDALELEALENANQPLLVWKDTRSSSIANQIYYQVVKTDGTTAFAANGKSLTASATYEQKNHSSGLHKNSGLFASVWEEDRGITKAFIQAGTISGTAPWGTAARELSNAATVQQQIKINAVTENNTEFFYTGWTDDNNDFMSPVVKICGQKVAADGTLLWGPAGKTIADQEFSDVLADLVGRYYIWENQNFPDNNIFVKLVDENGNTAPGWPENGLVVCNALGNQEKARGYLTPQGLLVTWEDLRSGANKDIYGQLIGENGQIKWAENGVKLAGQTGDQVDAKAAVGSDGVYLIWDDFRAANNDVYLQKFNYLGSELFTANGMQVTTVAGNQKNPAVTLTGDNVVLGWEDYRAVGGSDIYVHILNTNGSADWTSEVQVTSAIKNQQKPVLVNGSGSDMFVFWSDGRSSGKSDIYGIYGQKFNATGVGIDNEELGIINEELFQNYPNPFNNSTVVNFQLKLAGDIKLSVFNAKGELVKTLFNGKQQAGKHSFAFDGAGLNSGIYFYKLEAEGRSVMKKMILLK